MQHSNMVSSGPIWLCTSIHNKSSKHMILERRLSNGLDDMRKALRPACREATPDSEHRTQGRRSHQNINLNAMHESEDAQQICNEPVNLSSKAESHIYNTSKSFPVLFSVSSKLLFSYPSFPPPQVKSIFSYFHFPILPSPIIVQPFSLHNTGYYFVREQECSKQ